MELFGPVQGIGHEKVAYFIAPKVKDIGAPVLLLTAARIRVLIAGLTIKFTEGEGVLREVRWDPVNDDADAGVVHSIDKRAQVIGISPSRAGGVVARDLIAPGSSKRMLGHRH